MKELIKKIIKRSGYQISKFPGGLDKELIELLKKKKVDLVLDIGANVGQYGTYLRSIGYKGRLISFEPLENEFIELKKIASGDSNWEVHNIALGNIDGNITINVSGNSYSSSILDMKDEHLESAPESRFVRTQNIEIRKLDNFISENGITDKNIFLKADVQGYEKNVLLGVEKKMNLVKMIQLELSLEEMYQGEVLFNEMVNYLKSVNFYLSLLNSEFRNPNSHRLLQVNAVFLKEG